MAEQPDRAAVSRIAELRSWAFPRLQRLGRLLGIGALSGLIAGLVVGGIGGRIAMRIIAVAGGDSIQGLVTENGNVVGQITMDGTIGLLIFGGALAGMFGGLLSVGLRWWLPASRWRGVALGSLLLLIFGSIMVSSSNSDFARLGPRALNILLFAALFPLFGLALEPVAVRLERILPAVRPGLAISSIVYAAMAIVFLVAFVVAVVFNLRATADDPSNAPLLAAFVGVLGLGLLSSDPPPHGTGRTLGNVLLVALCLMGVAFDLKEIAEILAA